jgi:hypothetical protein
MNKAAREKHLTTIIFFASFPFSSQAVCFDRVQYDESTFKTIAELMDLSIILAHLFFAMRGRNISVPKSIG